MKNEALLHYCLEKRRAFLCHPFGPGSDVIKVSAGQGTARIFAQFFTLHGVPAATFNCDEATGIIYRSLYPGAVQRGYHCPPVQQPYFNTVLLDGTVPHGELIAMIDHAYAAVVKKLPKRARQELEAVESET